MSDYETIAICQCGKPLFIEVGNKLYCPVCKLVNLSDCKPLIKTELED